MYLKHLDRRPVKQVESTSGHGYRELSSAGFPITKQWGGLFLFQDLCLWVWSRRTKTTHHGFMHVYDAHSQDPCVSVVRFLIALLSLFLSIFTYASHLLAHLGWWLSVLRDQVFKSLNYYLPRFSTWHLELELLMKRLLDWNLIVWKDHVWTHIQNVVICCINFCILKDYICNKFEKNCR